MVKLQKIGFSPQQKDSAILRRRRFGIRYAG